MFHGVFESRTKEQHHRRCQAFRMRVPARFTGSGVHNTSLQVTMRRNVDIHKYLYVDVVLSSDTNVVVLSA